jgi:inosose dehydratase
MDRAAPFARVLDEMAGAGYAGTELGDWGFMPTDPARLREELARRNLALLGAFVPVRLADERAHAPGLASAVRTARLLAAASGERPVIVLADDNGTDARRTSHAGRIAPDESLSPAEWSTFAAGAERIARAVGAETGLRTVLHPHCAGFVETPWEVDELMTRTDPAVLGLCFDSGHAAYGGDDPVALCHRHAGRIWHVHFKDCDRSIAARARDEAWDYFKAVRHGVFCELGQGGVDFAALARTLQENGYDDWIVVEQDVLPGMGSPADSAGRNRQFLLRLGL